MEIMEKEDVIRAVQPPEVIFRNGLTAGVGLWDPKPPAMDLLSIHVKANLSFH